MTDLFPAAQEVLDAYGSSPLLNDHVLDHRHCLAAALRTAADQWRNEIREQPKTGFICGIQNCADALDDIAAELEDAND